MYQDIESVEKDGDYGVVVASKRPFGSLPAHLTMLGMLPPSVAEQRRGVLPEANRHRSLPFRVVDPRRSDRDDGESELLEAGHPQGQKVACRFIPELSTRTAALRAGELQVIDRVTPDLVETLKGTRGVKVLDVPTMEAQRWIFQLGRSR